MNRELMKIRYLGIEYQVRKNQISSLPFELWTKEEVQKALQEGLVKDLIIIKPQSNVSQKKK